MEIFKFNTKEEAIDAVYDLYVEANKNGIKSYGFATGGTPEALYAKLRASDLDYTDAVSVNLDEYYGLAADHPSSYAYFMNEQLFAAKPFKANYLPNGLNPDPEDESKRYEAVIAENPVDIQLLGIGENGHIAFNEPGTSFDSVTHLVDLTDSTIEANKRFFDSYDEVPKQAYTMGISTILKGKEMVLLAFGANKAEAVKAMIEGTPTEDCPASALQNHPNVKVYLDKEAAQLLSN